eukprot:4130464-Heterocapsa_arctica.AAC.1
MPAILAFEKGRSRDPALRAIFRRASAYRIACGVDWRLRFMYSEVNPTDSVSREAQKKKWPP